MTGSVHDSGAPVQLADPALLAAQRRQARRTALLLGIVAVCVYVGFILAIGLKH